MVHLWLKLSLISILCALLSPVLTAETFENTGIARIIELEGAVVRSRSTFAIKALGQSNIYKLAFGADEHSKTSFLEARVKGQQKALELRSSGMNPKNGTFIYSVELPKTSFNSEGEVVLEVDAVQTHATYPWPPEAAQGQSHFLKYETDLFVVSPYRTNSQRTRIRAPSPNIVSYSTLEDMQESKQAPATKIGTTINYGPFNNTVPSTTVDFAELTQKRVVIHYEFDEQVLEITKMKRAAEISHWGSNLNIQDELHLHNAGAKLQGHFSRVDHQLQAIRGGPSRHIIQALNIQLPPGIRDAYYYDLVGNVSTSHLRTVPSVPKGVPARKFSNLVLRPRYPLMGGWNYSFTLGWDSPLEDSTGWDVNTGRYIVSVPIMSLFPGSVVDEAEIKIVLPEGATDFEIYPPFPPKTMTQSIHTTYLDTIGRPEITLEYTHLTDRQTGVIYVTYKVPISTHLRKPFAVATAFLGIFTIILGARRVDGRIRK